MHPTQRKLMKRIILFLSLLFCVICPATIGQDVGLVANVKNSTCRSGISSQGNIDLGVVGVGYLSSNVTPEGYQPDGKEFTITVSDYASQGTGDALDQLRIDFRALNDVVVTDSRQIFANEISSGASDVGVVVFSTQNSADTFSVLNASGESRSVYPVMSGGMDDSSQKFSTQMQKIDPASSVISGQLMSHVLVDIYYEQQTGIARTITIEKHWSKNEDYLQIHSFFSIVLLL